MTYIKMSLAIASAGLVVLAAGPAFAQSASSQAEPPEEITVRGQKPLEEYRIEVELAREELIAAYNEANSTDRNDIVCRNERVTGTRMPQRVCRSKAQSEAEASASSAWLRSMTHSAGRYQTPLGQTPEPVLPQVNASIGAAEAQGGAEMLSAESRAAIEAELETLKKENRQVYRAIVKYLEALDEYNRARGVTADQ